MSLNGDYTSMAEAVGEAPPRTGITGSEFDEILWDSGGDYDAAMEAVEAIDRSQTEASNRWYEEHNPGTYEDGYRQALIDNGIDTDDEPLECEGHPSGPYDPMGETVYCDGTCR